MKTIRARLAVAYVVALGISLGVFAAALYLIQRTQNFAELDQRARDQTDRVVSILEEAYSLTGPIVIDDPLTGRPRLAPSVAALLDAIPNYVIISDQEGDQLYLSGAARALTIAEVDQLLEVLSGPSVAERFSLLDLGDPVGEVRYFTRGIDGAGPMMDRILTGVPISGLILGPRRLLSAMLLITPLIIGASILVGYYLAGRALEPVDGIVDEVEEISDGRSLHRRLAPLDTGDELARLTTTLNAMMARLESSFASLRRFTADASHELKTPLTVLRSGIESALTHPKAPPEQMITLEETLIEVKRMSELVDSLLVLARADEGRAELHFESIDLRDLFNDVSETAAILGEEAMVMVSVDLPDEPIMVRADGTRIRQMLLNLVTNAIKYTPKGGRVSIDCVPRNGRIKVEVSDTGIGIAPGDLPHIFDRFWRADPARSRTGERAGAGLGLAICRWIAEAHGGSIYAHSKPGRGSTFTVILPTENPGEEAQNQAK